MRVWTQRRRPPQPTMERPCRYHVTPALLSGGRCILTTAWFQSDSDVAR
jgi:hypothetical protein